MKLQISYCIFNSKLDHENMMHTWSTSCIFNWEIFDL